MSSLDKLLNEKKYALIAILLIFTGIFPLSIDDTVLIGVLRVVVFIAAAVLIFISPGKTRAPLPEPPSEEEYEEELKMALERRKKEPGMEAVPKNKNTDYYIPHQELPEDLMEKAENDFEKMIRYLVEITRSALASDVTGFYYLDSSGATFHLKQASVNEGFTLSDEVPAGNSLLDSVLNNNRTILENSIPGQSNAINYHGAEDAPVVSFIGSPVHYKDKAIGLVFADSASKGHFSEGDKTFIENLAGTISTGIANTDRLYETASVARSYSLFEKLNQDLAASLSSKDIFSVITNYLINHYHIDRLTISTVTGAGELVVEQVVGPKDIVRPGEVIEINDGLVGLILRQAKPLMIGNVDSGGGEYTARFYKNEPHGQPMSSFLGVPALNGGRVISVITLESLNPNRYDEDDKNLLTAMSGHVALALNRGHILKRLEELTVRDDLTGAWNDRGFKQRWEEEKARSKRFKEKLGLIKLELDGFEQIVETYGKSASNALLAEFVNKMKTLVRTVDYMARSGKNTFLIILPSTSKMGAKVLSERIRKQTADAPFYIEGRVIRVTLSGAIVEFPDMGETDDEIMAKLDKTLRYCKQSDGNQVTIYTSKIEGTEGNRN